MMILFFLLYYYLFYKEKELSIIAIEILRVQYFEARNYVSGISDDELPCFRWADAQGYFGIQEYASIRVDFEMPGNDFPTYLANRMVMAYRNKRELTFEELKDLTWAESLIVNNS